MKNFIIQLDGGEETVTAHIREVDTQTIPRYEVWVVYLMSEGLHKGWHGTIECDGDGWKQARESLESGPILPAFLVETLGAQIRLHTGQ